MDPIVIKAAVLLQLVGTIYSYHIGETYVYLLKSDVYLGDGFSAQNQQKTGHQIGYGVEAKAHITTVWEDPFSPLTKLAEIFLGEVDLTVTPADARETKERRKHASGLTEKSHYPLYVLYKDNEIVRVWSSTDDDITYLNIKKGVASFFQYQVTSEVKQSQVDVSGKCVVTFIADGTHVKKQKQQCVHPDLQQYEHPHPVRSVDTHISSQTNYQLKADLSCVNIASASESIRMTVNAWPEATIEVIAHHALKLKLQSYGLKKLSDDGIRAATTEVHAGQRLEALLGARYRKDTIIARPHRVNHATTLRESLSERIALFRERLSIDQLATFKSSMAFLTLLEVFRISTEDSIVNALNDLKNRRIAGQLLDIAAATQTLAALRAALRFVGTGAREDAQRMTERFLLGLSMASHPSREFVAELHKLVAACFDAGKQNSLICADQHVRATALASLGSVLRHALANDPRMAAAGDALSWIEAQLAACGTGAIEKLWTSSLLVALRNAAQPATITTIVDQLARLPAASDVVVALRALREIGVEHFSSSVFDILETIYFQTKDRQESTARALAAEMLLTCGDAKRVRRVLVGLGGDSKLLEDSELRTLVAGKFRQTVGQSHAAAAVASNHSLSNYHTLAHGGSSATFTRLLAKSRNLNATYSLNMELVSGGLLKQTTFDINLQASSAVQMPLISVNIFAAGLSAFAGDDLSSSQAGDMHGSEETTAGMILTILGVEMRPYVFFRGTGELMSHVWAGTGSEYTPAIQGNFLLMDHMQLLPLLNGFIVQLQLKGVLSVDLGGSIQVSIWNRNSHSVVQSGGAALIQGSARLLSGVASARVEINVGAESHLNFITDFSFYEKPYQMCIQMTNPGLSIKHNVRKYEAIDGKQHLVRTLRRRSTYVEGRSYPLTRKNSEMCSLMAFSG